MVDHTIKFPVYRDPENNVHDTLTSIYDALAEKGYDPVNQIVGYLVSEDPTYITNYRNARTMIRKLDRNDLLRELVRSYLHL